MHPLSTRVLSCCFGCMCVGDYTVPESLLSSGQVHQLWQAWRKGCHAPESMEWRKLLHSLLWPRRASQPGSSRQGTSNNSTPLRRMAEDRSSLQSGYPTIHLDDATIRVAVDLRVGATICEPYNCRCGCCVDKLVHKELSCRYIVGRLSFHANLNDAVKRPPHYP